MGFSYGQYSLGKYWLSRRKQRKKKEFVEDIFFKGKEKFQL